MSPSTASAAATVPYPRLREERAGGARGRNRLQSRLSLLSVRVCDASRKQTLCTRCPLEPARPAASAAAVEKQSCIAAQSPTPPLFPPLQNTAGAPPASPPQKRRSSQPAASSASPPSSPRVPLGAGCFGQMLAQPPAAVTPADVTPATAAATAAAATAAPAGKAPPSPLLPAHAPTDAPRGGGSGLAAARARPSPPPPLSHINITAHGPAVPAVGLMAGSPDPRRRSNPSFAHFAAAPAGAPTDAVADTDAFADADATAARSPSAVSPPKRVPRPRRSPLSGGSGGGAGGREAASAPDFHLRREEMSPLGIGFVTPSPYGREEALLHSAQSSLHYVHSLSPSPHRFRGTLEVWLVVKGRESWVGVFPCRRFPSLARLRRSPRLHFPCVVGPRLFPTLPSPGVALCQRRAKWNAHRRSWLYSQDSRLGARPSLAADAAAGGRQVLPL